MYLVLGRIFGKKEPRVGAPNIRFQLRLQKMRYLFLPLKVQENPRVRKIFVRNSVAGNGYANFMGAWKNASILQEKPCP